MTPLGHLAISVLLAYTQGYADRVFALCLAGALLPDLIDKPLVALGIVPVSHTVGHSVLVVGIAAGIVLVRPQLRAAVPLVIGWAGHIGADLIVAYPKFIVNYFWPVLAVRPTPDDPLLAYWLEYAASPLGALEAAVIVAAVAVLYAQKSTRKATLERHRD